MVVTANWFKEWFNSPYYHLLYFERDDREAAAFINQLIKYLNPAPGSMMMDMACGRGRHSRILSSHGYDVTGVDLSTDSIREAQKFEKEDLHFYQHDMRLPFWMNYFHYAFNFFTSFGYFKTEREHYNAIRTIANALKPGGILVMDYLNVHYAEDHLVHKSDKEVNAVNFYITKWYDETHFYKKISVADPLLKQPQEYTEKVAKFSLGDFTDMLSFQGLQVTEVFGDYAFGDYHVKKTPRLILIATKDSIDQGDKDKRLYSDGRTTDALT